MSSYFDKMATCLHDKTGKELVKLVFEQYWHYLMDINENTRAEDEEKMSNLLTAFYKLKESFDKGSLRPEFAIEELHDFAHDVGSARITLNDGRIASDNPWLYY